MNEINLQKKNMANFSDNTRPLEDKLTAENAKLRALIAELAGYITFWFDDQCLGSRLEKEVRYEALMSKVKEVLGD